PFPYTTLFRSQLRPREMRAAELVVDPRLEAERGNALQHPGDDARVGADLVLRVRIGPHRQEVEQVVEVDLPVPLGVGGEGEIDPRELARDVPLDQPGVLLGRELPDALPALDRLEVDRLERRTRTTLSVRRALRLYLLGGGAVEQERHEAVPPTVFVQRVVGNDPVRDEIVVRAAHLE